MSSPRIFVPLSLTKGQEVVLDAASSHHVLQVLRLSLNSAVVVFNNTGGEYHATLIAIDRKKAVISIGEFTSCNNESPIAIHLGQGISRGEKMDFTIQKAVELGVNTITPLFTEYCNVKLTDDRLKNRIHHWQNIAISAAEQSGRCYVPKIIAGQNLMSWCNTETSGLRLVLTTNTTNKIGAIIKRPTNVIILVGPEGGLSNQEIENAEQSNFLPINLGPRILRTETAALVAISLLQAKWGDL